MDTLLGQLGLVVAGAIVGAALTAGLAVLDHRRNVKSDRAAREQEFRRVVERERETRHEEHLWRRREEFEKLLAEFIPVFEKWRLYERSQALQAFEKASDMTPEPEPSWVEDLQGEVDKFVAQLKVRSPSEALDRTLQRVAETRDAVWKALIFNNHVLISGNEENKDEAFREFFDKIEAFDGAVRHLTEETSQDGRRHGPSGYASSPAQGSRAGRG